MTMRWSLLVSAQAAADVGQRHGARVDLEGTAGDGGGQAGSSATMSRVGTDPCPLPTICRRAARSAADGIAAVGPATEPISIQVSGCARSARAVTTAAMASAVGGPHR